MKTIALWFFVTIWFIHLILGVGAGYAALRLWYARHHPLVRWVGLYINGFIVEAITAITLIFVARGVHLTWKFSSVMFIGAFLGDLVRAPLIVFLIRGQTPPLP